LGLLWTIERRGKGVVGASGLRKWSLWFLGTKLRRDLGDRLYLLTIVKRLVESPLTAATPVRGSSSQGIKSHDKPSEGSTSSSDTEAVSSEVPPMILPSKTCADENEIEYLYPYQYNKSSSGTGKDEPTPWLMYGRHQPWQILLTDIVVASILKKKEHL